MLKHSIAVPTVGEYFERRVRPRIDTGVGLMKVSWHMAKVGTWHDRH